MQILAHAPQAPVRHQLTQVLTEAALEPVFLGPEALARDAYLLGTHEARDKVLVLAGVAAPHDLVANLRRHGRTTPVLALLGAPDSKAAAALLRAGADDVMAGPVDSDELSARVGALVRRAHGLASDTVEVGEVRVYLDGRDPEVAGASVSLTRREQDILRTLALRAGRMVTKEALYQTVYGMEDAPPLSKVVEVHVCTLRKKLAAASRIGAHYIETVKRRGYRLGDPDLSGV